jgi:hypothetical protein
MRAERSCAPGDEAGARDTATARLDTDSSTGRLLVEAGGSQLWLRCPVNAEHRALIDLDGGLAVCLDCCLSAPITTWRRLLDLRRDRDFFRRVVAAWEADPALRRARARAERVEAEYVEGLASLVPSEVPS